MLTPGATAHPLVQYQLELALKQDKELHTIVAEPLFPNCSDDVFQDAILQAAKALPKQLRQPFRESTVHYISERLEKRGGMWDRFVDMVKAPEQASAPLASRAILAA